MKKFGKRNISIAALAAALLALAIAQDVLRPTVVHNVSFDAITMDRPFTVHQQVLELAPGAASPVHMHGGPELVLVLEGEVTFLLEENGESTTVATGETYSIEPHTFLQVSNETDANASFVVTFLLPEGETLTTPR